MDAFPDVEFVGIRNVVHYRAYRIVLRGGFFAVTFFVGPGKIETQNTDKQRQSYSDDRLSAHFYLGLSFQEKYAFA